MRFPLIILAVLFCSGGAVALAGGNHCDSIHEAKANCDEIKDLDVQIKCNALKRQEHQARERQQDSCEKESVANQQKSGCLITASDQKGIDACNASSDGDLRDNAKKAGEDQGYSKGQIKNAKDELKQAIEDCKANKDRDQSGISEAENAVQEGAQIQKESAAAQADDLAAAEQFAGNDTTGVKNAAGLGSVPDSAPAPSGSAPSGTGSPAASTSPDSGASPAGAASAAAPAAQSAAQALTSSPQGGSTPAGEQATAPTPVPQSAANAAPAENVGGGASPVTGNLSNLAQNSTSPARSGAASTASPGSTPAQPTTPSASTPSETPSAGGGVESNLRAALRARLENSSGSSTMGGGATSSYSGGGASGGGGSGVAIGGGRSLASAHAKTGSGGEAEIRSEDKPEVVAGGQEELHAFTSSLGHPEISLMGSETDASVRRMMGEFSGENAAKNSQASDEDIGDKNGPTLFARSHAVYERALRRGKIRGVAIR
ncbi:MAG: hypothetical protein ACXVCG_08155 [Bdellovibrionota bacterium]